MPYALKRQWATLLLCVYAIVHESKALCVRAMTGSQVSV